MILQIYTRGSLRLLDGLKSQDPVPERPISANPGLNFVPFLPPYVLLRVTFYAIIIVSRSKGSTVFCKLELHVLRQENLA